MPCYVNVKTDRIPKLKTCRHPTSLKHLSRHHLVDDQQAILDVVKALLEELGYCIEIRQDAAEALESFQQDPYKFDLVMTDYFMPRMKGDCLAREIVKVNPDIPIILFTGFRAEIDDIESARSGISEALDKPITLTVLARTVRKILDGTKA